MNEKVNDFFSVLLDTEHSLKYKLNKENFEKHLCDFTKMSNTAVEIELKLNKSIQKVEDFDYDALFEKVVNSLNTLSNDIFTRREILNLPFLLYRQPKDININQYIISLFNSASYANSKILNREIMMYFMNYGVDAVSNVIRQDIIEKFYKKDLSRKRFAIWSNNLFLFGEDAHYNLGEQLISYSFQDLLKKYALNGVLSTSMLVLYSLLHFFKFDKISENRKLEVFKEIYSYNLFKDANLARIADFLIPAVDRMGAPDDVEYLRTLFLNEFGDPRFNRNNVKWSNVSQNTKDIFIRWIAKYDINLFFEIIRDTMLDSDGGTKMWQYRQAFWLAYLPHIKNTWVILGENAARDVRRMHKNQKLHYGRFSRSAATRSAFYFEIGKFSFIEQSHNGKLRIWVHDNCPITFGQLKIAYDDITSSSFNCVKEIVHSSSVTYNWQNKASQWIARNCQILINKQSWRI
jgi:hypothetical protein